MYLSVIIPAYNEEKRLPKTLDDISAYLKRQDYQSEIIVVNGGSTDKTPEIVRDKMRGIGNLQLLEAKNSGGKGGAVKAGMLKASGKFRLFTDADNSTSVEQIEKMWPEFEKGYGVVIGSRDVKGAVLDPPQPWLRNVFLGEGFKIYRKFVVGLWDLEDTQCGFKCFGDEVVEKVFSKAIIKGFAFDPEILILAKRAGYKIKEVPVYWKNDPDSKVSPANVIKMAVDLMKIRWHLILGKYGS
ncbi:MAG: glycosyltransferase [Candidatus Nealsonbacteria bacterium]|nr:glycosyltransferase [Candidatus Nealsonbacteria bacterium]